ncbi:hypothetical protein ABBQ38_012523 [Trebouxia sp. C0009 RCD-2024]
MPSGKGEGGVLDSLQRDIHSAVKRAAKAEKQAQKLQDLLKQLAKPDKEPACLPTRNGAIASEEQAASVDQLNIKKEQEAANSR